MPVTDITKDIENRTLAITAEFAAPVERVWALYADPRQLEKVWGPPEYPATFVDHDLRPGGRSTYYMTSPEGERFAGYWDITEVEAPRRLAFRDGFAHADLNAQPRAARLARTTSSSRRPRAAPARCSRAATTPPRTCRRCSTWAWRRAPRSAINQIDGFLAAHPQHA